MNKRIARKIVKAISTGRKKYKPDMVIRAMRKLKIGSLSYDRSDWSRV